MFRMFEAGCVSGQVIKQSLENRPVVFSTKEGPDSDDVSYMGYSTVIGDFSGDGEQGVAVGMPRGSDLFGKVCSFSFNQGMPVYIVISD